MSFARTQHNLTMLPDGNVFVVGGAVRDLLVGRRPKDFDVATDATPELVDELAKKNPHIRALHVGFLLLLTFLKKFMGEAAAKELIDEIGLRPPPPPDLNSLPEMEPVPVRRAAA